MIRYRTMKPDDIPAALSLCRYAGWNQISRDWEIFLLLSPDNCRVAEQEKVVGTVTTVRFQNRFSWIGMVLVDPEKQQQGIGMQLLGEALQILQHQETVKLDATPSGRKVYLKLNFVDEYPLTRMHSRSAESHLITSAARVVQKNDLSKIFEFDCKIFGANRQPLLEWQFNGAPEYAFLIEDKNEIQGYCLGRAGQHAIHIGPVIANSLDIAKDLVSAVLSNCIGHAVILDISNAGKHWMPWLTSIGFLEQRPFFRMYLGPNRYPGEPQKQFAILGPEFG